MTTPRMLYRDEFQDGTLTVSTEAVDFPKENLQNELRTKTLRSTAVTAEWWLFNFGATPPIINAIALIGGNLYSEAVDIRIQANGTDSWGSPAVDEVITIGTQLVGNPTFDINTTGWVASNCVLASVGGGQSNNCLEITRVTANAQAASQTISTFKVGRRYLMSGYVKKGGATDQAFQINVSRVSGAAVTIQSLISGTADSSWTRYSQVFIATEASLGFQLVKNNALGEVLLFDEVYIYEIPESDMLIHYTAADYSYQYWRLSLGAGTGSYFELGRLMGGKYFQPSKSFDVDYQRTLNDLSTSSMSIGGQGYEDVKDQFTTLQLNFSNMTTTDRDSMLAMYTQARKDRNIALNVDTTAADKPDLSYYGKFTEAFNFTNTLKTAGNERHSMSIAFKESI